MSELSSVQTGPVQVNSLIVPLAHDKVFIVDPAGCVLTGDEYGITGFLEQHQLDPVAVVLTHGHFDHVIGLPAVRSAYPGIPIAIHTADQHCIGAASSEYQRQILTSLGASSILSAVSNLPAADYLLEDKKTLADIFGLEYCLFACKNNTITGHNVFSAFSNWKVLHTPGHTPGSVCLYNELEKKLISGDTVFYHSYGRTDLYGGSETEMSRSLSLLAETVHPDVLVYPGHETIGFPFSDAI